MMERSSIFPGSFDPLTLGHCDIINRASKLFDVVYVAIGVNSLKPRLFPVDLTVKMIESAFIDNPKVKVIHYDNLTVDICRELKVNYIVRGIRNVSDFEFERSLSEMNRTLNSDLETIFLDSRPAFITISSTIIRDLIRNNGNIKPFVPAAILPFIKKS
jgi:pantetheine-phosphate adenylyltransferase